MVESHTIFAHILAQTRQNIELLVAHKEISDADGEEILCRLGSCKTERHTEDSSIVSLVQKTEQLNVSLAPPKVEARAIWGWTSEDLNDLTFEAGDIIEVITETNADWWMGRNKSGKQGLFPSNYVEKLHLSPILVPEPRSSMTSIHSKGPGEQRYPSPARAHPQPYGAVPQSNYTPGGGPGYYPPPGGPPPPGTVSYSYGPPAGPPTPQPVGQGKKSKFGGLGQVMAQSAASGAGFGAGAAVGSGVVNTLF